MSQSETKRGLAWVTLGTQVPPPLSSSLRSKEGRREREGGSTPRTLFTNKAMKKNKNVYVVELDESVKANKKFMKANVGHDPTLPGLYVGRTGLPPEKRFQKHKEGHKSSGIVKRFGIKLLQDLYEPLNPMTFE